jgi:hypothetical protein
LYNFIDCSNSNLQPKFSQILNRAHSLPLSSVSSLSEEVRRALESVVSIVDDDQIFTDFSPAHMQASASIMDILRGEEEYNLCSHQVLYSHHMLLNQSCTAESDSQEMLNLAGAIRDYPGMNFHLWLKAFLTVSLERRDLIALRKPNPLELSPEHFLSKDNYRDAVKQAGLPPDQRVVNIHYDLAPLQLIIHLYLPAAGCW